VLAKWIGFSEDPAAAGPTQSPKALPDARAPSHAQKFGGKAAFAFGNPLRTTRST